MAGQARASGTASSSLTGSFEAHIDLEDLVIAEHAVVCRTTYRGIHVGEFEGIAATGRRVAFGAIDLLRFRGGHIVEDRHYGDLRSLTRQLEAT